MVFRYALVFMIAAGLAGPVSAEFYRYKDENGVLRFTDNPEEVPEDQLENVRKYKESVTTPAASADKGAKPADKKKSSEKKSTGYVNPIVEEINRIDDALNKELADMEEERMALQSMGDDVKNNPEYRSAYEARLAQYNARVAAYEEKVRQRNQKVKEYEAEEARREQARRQESEKSE